MHEPPPSRGFALGTLRALGRRLVQLPRALLAAASLAWMAMIWSLSSGTLPGPSEPSPLWRVATNLAHAPLFGFLALALAALAVRRAPGEPLPRLGPVAAAWTFVVVALWGAIDEWHQARVPGRHASGFDLATDLVGAFCVLWIARYATGTRASERGTRARLLAAALLCVAAALAATFLEGPAALPDGDPSALDSAG